MTLDQFFRIIKARWLLVVLVTLSVASLVVGLNLMLPKKYVSTASIMADLRPDPVSALSAATGLGGSYLATQVDIIKSPHVARRVVENLKIGDNADMRKDWEKDTKGQGDYLAWIGETIGRGLDVKPSRESNVIEITYEGIEPAFAAAMANAFAQAYIDTTVQARTGPAKQYEDFFGERAKMARVKLERAQEKLATAQREKGMVATDARVDFENSRLNDIAAQITGLRAMKTESSSRSREVARNPDQNSDVLASGLISGMKADLIRQESAMQQGYERYGDAHPVVIESKANIAELKRRIREETSRVTASVKISNQVTTDREAQLNAAFEEQRARVLKLNEQRNELQVLEREVDFAQKIYDSIQARLTQTNLESSSSQSGIYMLSSATIPPHHASPRVFINTVVAAGLGFLLSLIVAMLVELFDRRVRGPFDLVQVLELPVLGVLPDGKTQPRGLKALLKSRSLSIGKNKNSDASLVVSH